MILEMDALDKFKILDIFFSSSQIFNADLISDKRGLCLTNTRCFLGMLKDEGLLRQRPFICGGCNTEHIGFELTDKGRRFITTFTGEKE